MHSSRHLHSLLLVLSLALLPGCRNPFDSAGAVSGPTKVGQLPSKGTPEASGLAPSLRRAGTYYINNDSGNTPELHLVDSSGKHLGSVWVDGVPNQDWEACASFRHGGRAWLLIADTGDNDQNRAQVMIHVIEEPDPALLKPERPLHVRATRTLRFKYPQGPRDCEAVAACAQDGKIYLVSKRSHPPALYSLPLHADGSEPLTATKLCDLAWLKTTGGASALLPTPRGRFSHQPTALDISQDGRRAVLLTYGEPWYFERKQGQPWEQVLAQPGTRVPGNKLPQAEAACLSADGRYIFVTTEGNGADLLRHEVNDRR